MPGCRPINLSTTVSCYQSLYNCMGGLSMLEHDLLVLRQDLQCMAQKQMSKGATKSMQTLGNSLLGIICLKEN